MCSTWFQHTDDWQCVCACACVNSDPGGRAIVICRLEIMRRSVSPGNFMCRVYVATVYPIRKFRRQEILS